MSWANVSQRVWRDDGELDDLVLGTERAGKGWFCMHMIDDMVDGIMHD